MPTKPRGAFIPAFASIVTTADTLAGASRDVFDEDSYTAYSYETDVTEQGITYTQADGKFTVAKAGIYCVTFGASWVGNALDEYSMEIQLDGVAIYDHDVIYVHTATDPEYSTVSILSTIPDDTGSFYNFIIKSQDGIDTATVWAGACVSIHRVG